MTSSTIDRIVEVLAACALLAYVWLVLTILTA